MRIVTTHTQSALAWIREARTHDDLVTAGQNIARLNPTDEDRAQVRAAYREREKRLVRKDAA